MQRHDESEERTNAYGVRTSATKKIDGHRYETHMYPAGEGFDHIPFLLELLGNPSGLVLDAAVGIAKIGNLQEVPITGTQLREACESMARMIHEHGGHEKMRELLKHTLVKVGKGDKASTLNVADDYDSWGQGRYSHQIKVLTWVLEFNFAPFLRDALTKAFTRLKDVKPGLHGVLSTFLDSSTSEAASGSTSD